MYSVLAQYYGGTVAGGSPSTDVKYESHFGKALTDKDPYPAYAPGQCELAAPCIGEAQIEAELQSFIKAHKLPTQFTPGNEAETAYFVLLAPGVNTCFLIGVQACAGRQFCAYHFYDGTGNPSPLEGYEVFAVQPYIVGLAGCDIGRHPNGISDGALDGGLVHEYEEMVTDPYGANWKNLNTLGGEEVGDICSNGYWGGETMKYGAPLGTAPNGSPYNQLVNGHEYWYRQMWSNETYSCLQRSGLPPAVTKLTPKEGPVTGNTKVEITGLNFENPTVTAVKFGATAAASFTVTSPTSITAVSPPGAAGAVDVTVTTSAGTSASVAADHFTY